MNTVTLTPDAEVAVWLRILHPDGKFTAKSARAILQMSFPNPEKTQMQQLSAKAREGTLTADEEQQMDAYERVGAMLSILKSKARQALKKSHRGN